MKKSKKGKRPKYQNKTTYKVQFKQHLIDLQEQTPRDHLCKRCFDIIDWKLKYGKFKKLKVPGRCQKCNNKCVLKSYRHNCDPCSEKLKICSKCSKPTKTFVPFVNPKKEEQKNNEFLMKMNNVIKKFRECSRRKLYRLMDSELVQFKDGKFIYRETGLEVEDLQLQKKYREDLDDDDLFDDDNCDILEKISDESGSYKADD